MLNDKKFNCILQILQIKEENYWIIRRKSVRYCQCIEGEMKTRSLDSKDTLTIIEK